MRNELAKEIELKIDANVITSYFVDELEKLAQKHHGKRIMKLVIYDEAEQMMVDTVAKKYLVEPSNDFFAEIAGFDGVEARLLSKGVEIQPERKPAYRQYANA